MSEKVARPEMLDLLIEDYGKFVGMPAIVFDDDNLLAFDLDGTKVTLHYKGDVVGLLLKAVMPIPTDAVSPGFLAVLHGVNFTAANVGIGTVMLDREFGAWVWLDRIDPRALTPALLHERIHRAAQNIAFWITQIPEMIAQTATDALPEEAPALDFKMIRV